MQTGQVSVTLEPRPDQVRVARERIGSLCAGMGTERAHVAKLLVSEVVTSAFRHRPRRVRLLARRDPEQLRVDVREEEPPSADDSGSGSRRQPPSMAILAWLASTWGERLSARRRTIWFTLTDH
jgi:hypothetical protein